MMFISEPMLNCAWDALPKPSDCHPPEWGKILLLPLEFAGDDRGNGGRRCFFKDWDMMERSFCLAWSGLTFRFTEPAVLCCGGMFQQQLVPFLLLPPIPNVPEGVLPSKAEFIQLLWHQCHGDLTGFQGRLNWLVVPLFPFWLFGFAAQVFRS